MKPIFGDYLEFTQELLERIKQLEDALRAAIAEAPHAHGCPITNYRVPCECWRRPAVEALQSISKNEEKS